MCDMISYVQDRVGTSRSSNVRAKKSISTKENRKL